MRRLLSEMIPLAVHRDGGLVWEYYFQFDGGDPPWTSAMSQGTGLEALTRASRRSTDPSYLPRAHRALPIFTVAAADRGAEGTPLGDALPAVLVRARTWIINAFLQSLIGLYDYAQVSRDRLAARLFAAGDAEARIEVPRYDTGAWSLYQPGVEDTLDYHKLVTGFLQELCARTHAAVYCTTAARFNRDLKTPPALTMLTHRVPTGSPVTLRFRLSKYSHVGIVVVEGDAHGVPDERELLRWGERVRDPAPPRRAVSDSTRCNRSRRTLQPDHRDDRGVVDDRTGRHRALDSASHEAADDPVHGEGRRREDLRGGLHGPAVRGGRIADARDLDRSRPQLVRIARSRALR